MTAFPQCILLLILSVTLTQLNAQSIDQSFNPTFTKTGFGSAIASQDDNKILVAGYFEYASDHQVNNFVRLLINGLPDTTFHYDDNIVGIPDAIAVQLSGKIIIGGLFNDPNGNYLGSILRLLPNGDMDTSFNIVKDSVKRFNLLSILPNQKIFSGYLRCDVTQPTNCHVYGVHLYDAEGMPDSHFAPIEFTPNHSSSSSSSVASINHQSDNSLLVFGTKLELDTFIQDAYRFDSIGTLDTLFDPIIPGISNFIVSSMDVLEDGTIGVIAGDRQNITLFDSSGQVMFTKFIENDYTKIVATNNSSFVVIGENTSNILKNGQVYTSPNGVDYYVFGIVNAPDGVIATGYFDQSGGLLVPGIIKYDVSTGFLTRDHSYEGSLLTPGTVSAIALQSDGKILAGGNFNYVNDQLIHHLVRLKADGTVDTTFNLSNSNISTTVSGIEILSDNSIVVIGRHNSGGTGANLNGLTLLEKDGFQASTIPFPYISTIGGLAYLTKDSGDNIYVGDGLAYKFGDISGQELMKYEFVTPINFSLIQYTPSNYNDLYVNSLYRFNGITVTANDKLLIFGSDLVYDSSDTTSIIRAHINGARDTSFQTDITSDFDARALLSFDTNTIFIAGNHGDIFNPTSGGFYKLNNKGKIDPEFYANILRAGSSDFRISAIKRLPYQMILVSGNFDSYNGTSVPSGKVIIDRDGLLIHEYLPEVQSATINEVQLIDSFTYYLGGTILAPNGASGLLRFNTCSDGIMNGDETGVDCGGSSCIACSDCLFSTLSIPTDSITGANLLFDQSEKIISNALINFDNIIFRAENEIILDSLFELKAGILFRAEIVPCINH